MSDTPANKVDMTSSVEVAQQDLFKAQTSWFHVFKSMVDSGDVAAMGPGPVTVYLVIKAYSNWADGRSFPSIHTICDKSGFSKPSVLRHLKTLEEHGYIRRESGKLDGRSNRYTLREKIVVNDNDGNPTALASWDYLPSTVKAAVAELRNVVLKGDFDGVKLINIQRLDINIGNLGFAETMSQLNIELQNLDPEIRQALESAVMKSMARKTSAN